MGKDLFSKHASQYAAFRPTYTKELYEFIFSLVTDFEMAWDAGTGNGQVARDLSGRFKKVFATDISTKQIENAVYAENIIYSIAGETTSFPEKSFDLICVAQAIHWFDRNKFYDEVTRIGKSNAVVAVWGYGLLSVNSGIDALIGDFYVNIVGPYWDKERKLVDDQYKTISFPFEEIQSPVFSFVFQWRFDELRGYLNTWSSVQKFIRENSTNPVEQLMGKIRPLWLAERMSVRFPLFLRVGKMN